jgi:hypothetical protein
MNDTFVRYPAAAHPQVNLDTYLVMDHAVVDLADRRYMKHLDAAVQLHLCASLIAQTEVWVAEQVGIARQDGATWTDIGRVLGVTATAARQRYGHNTSSPVRRTSAGPSNGDRPLTP